MYVAFVGLLFAFLTDSNIVSLVLLIAKALWYGAAGISCLILIRCIAHTCLLSAAAIGLGSRVSSRAHADAAS